VCQQQRHLLLIAFWRVKVLLRFPHKPLLPCGLHGFAVPNTVTVTVCSPRFGVGVCEHDMDAQPA
jgi:hypothetical protein